MARKPRVRARSGVYHVLMQGVRHRDIYIDDEDYRTFVEILERLQKSKDGEERYFTVYAYCLLPDHFHLMLKEEADITLDKMRTIFRIGLANNHDSLVLSAMGCGAFSNPPKHIAQLFHQVIEEEEFKNRFRLIDFAILDGYRTGLHHNPDGNLLPFQLEFL